METFIKSRLLFWIMIFLVVVNLSALATYFLYPRKAPVAVCSDGSAAPGCMLHAELGLTEVQAEQVDAINVRYLAMSSPVSQQIKEIRAEVLDELAAENPDTVKLDNFSRELSQLQGRLHRENMKHFLELKKVCTPDQAMRLSNLYRELYGCPMHAREAGGKHQHRKRE